MPPKRSRPLDPMESEDAPPPSSLSLECAVCRELFHHTQEPLRPRVLPCGHSFCGACVQQLVTAQGLCCPTCRHVAPVTDASQVKINFGLQEYLQFVEEHPLLKKRSATAPVDDCDLCEQPAVFYCLEDDAALCAEHRKLSHLLPAQQLHHICPIADKLKQKHAKPPQCSKHHSPMLIWCEDCTVICCETCASRGAHKGHTSQLIEDVAQGVRQQLEQQLSGTGKIQASLDVEVQRLLTIDRQLEADAAKEAQRVATTFRRLQADLKRQQQKLLEDVASQCKVARKQVDLRLQALAVCSSQASVAMEKGAACRHLPDHELLQHYAQVDQDHTTSEESAQEYRQESQLCIGVTVQGLHKVNIVCQPQLEVAKRMDTAIPLPGMQSVPRGTFLSKWGSCGNDDGQFDRPIGICISNNRVFVTDTYNHRVLVFDKQGRFVSMWGL